MKIVKVNNLPQTYEADTIYLVKSSTAGLVDIYVTDNIGTQIRSLAVDAAVINSLLQVSEVGVTVASLVDGKIPTNQLPSAILGALTYQGTWNANTNEPTIPAASPSNKGWYYVVNTVGTSSIGGVADWEIGDWVVSSGTGWGKIDNSDKVSSVAGKTGVVTLTKSDVNLGRVDDTSDADKPVSTAVQTALNGKAPLNGTGTSGTWPISVTGGAAKLTTTRKINGKDFDGTADITVPSVYDPNYTRMVSPPGGVFTTASDSVTGAITVVFPVGSTRTMTRVLVKIYEYITNMSFEVCFGGYNHPSVGWIQPFAYIVGNPSINRNFTVRLGKRGDGRVVAYIGELESTWSYPQVFITDVQLGYGGMVDWGGVWAIGFTTAAFESVSATISGSQIGYSAVAATANTLALRDSSGGLAVNSLQAKSPLHLLNVGVAQGIKVGSLTVSDSYSDNPPSYGIFSKGVIESRIATGTAPFIITSTTRVANLNVASAGAADSATKLATARSINGVNFDGSANISVPVDWSAVTGKPAVIAAGTDAATARSAIGAASLVGGKIPEHELPSLAITDVFPVASEAAMLALTAEKGDMAIRSDLNRCFALSAAPASTLANWLELKTPANAVLSVAGRTGAVILTGADVGLPSVNNTSDADKPVSTAQQNALNLKANLTSPSFTGNVVAQSSPESVGIYALQGGVSGFESAAQGNGGTAGAATIAFHRPGNFAVHFGLDTDNKIKVGGWSLGANAYAIYHENNKPTKADVSLGNVDNTSDTNKPVSTATQTALNLKANLESPALTTPVISGTREKLTAMSANTVDLATGNFFTKTVSGYTTFTVTNVPSTGTAVSFILELTNAGSATITWWSGVKWAGGTAPTLTASGVDVLGFYSHNGGATWRGFLLSKDSK